MNALSIILAIVAVIIGFIGMNYLTQATLGVGMVAFACLAAILARIVQAAAHHAAVRPRHAPQQKAAVAADGWTNG